MFPYVKRKKSRRYYLSAVFFPVFQAGKIFPSGAQENAENFRHGGKETKRPPLPPTSVQIIYNILGIAGGGITINVPVVYMVRYKVVLRGDYP
jgi:hypothetical protein